MSIEEVFPEVGEIGDVGLREKVVKVWEEALEIGGWKVDDLKRIPFTLLIPGIEVSLAEHTRAVARMSAQVGVLVKETYGDKLPLNSDYLLAGAILHDVGKPIEYAEREGRFSKSEKGKLLRHPLSGAALAYKHGLPFEVLHVIGAHSKEGDLISRGVEATIVYHVDFINFESLKARWQEKR